MSIKAADHLGDIVGLRNDIVYNTFSCPECRTEVTISRYQAAGELFIMCTRCNAKWQISGEEILDLNQADREFNGYKVFVKLDENQRDLEPPDNTPGNADGVTPADLKRKAAAAAAARAKAEAAKAEAPPAAENPGSA